MSALTPLSPTRRSLLTALAAGLGGVSIWPQCLAARTDLKPLSFVVVADTHIGYRDHESAARLWTRTATQIARSGGGMVVHLGDIVDRRQESQYPPYLEARKLIGKPVHEIPGNHDPKELFQKHIRKTVDTVVDYQWLRFILLSNAHTDSHDGFLTANQLDWIDTQCHKAAKNDRYICLCMHVPAHTNRNPDRGWYIKPANGQRVLYEIISRHQQRLLALMHGHFHNGIRGWEDHAPVHEICFPSALYNQDRGLEARKAPGYNPPTFNPGFTEVAINGGVMSLKYVPTTRRGRPLVKKCVLQQPAKK